MKKGFKRINFDVPEYIHTNIKAMSVRRGISMKEMFIKASYVWFKMNTPKNNGY